MKAVAAAALSSHPWPAQDIEAGKAVFRKCVACHAADTTTNKVGPHLAT